MFLESYKPLATAAVVLGLTACGSKPVEPVASDPGESTTYGPSDPATRAELDFPIQAFDYSYGEPVRMGDYSKTCEGEFCTVNLDVHSGPYSIGITSHTDEAFDRSDPRVTAAEDGSVNIKPNTFPDTLTRSLDRFRNGGSYGVVASREVNYANRTDELYGNSYQRGFLLNHEDSLVTESIGCATPNGKSTIYVTNGVPMYVEDATPEYGLAGVNMPVDFPKQPSAKEISVDWIMETGGVPIIQLDAACKHFNDALYGALGQPK